MLVKDTRLTKNAYTETDDISFHSGQNIVGAVPGCFPAISQAVSVADDGVRPLVIFKERQEMFLGVKLA
jgi:hypothetical protein